MIDGTLVGGMIRGIAQIEDCRDRLEEYAEGIGISRANEDMVEFRRRYNDLVRCLEVLIVLAFRAERGESV